MNFAYDTGMFFCHAHQAMIYLKKVGSEVTSMTNETSPCHSQFARREVKSTLSKNDNMLAILWMLSSNKKITARQIAEKLELNIRTVYRYIDSLGASGVPIISDSGHNGGYSLINDFHQAPLVFDIEEKKPFFMQLPMQRTQAIRLVML